MWPFRRRVPTRRDQHSLLDSDLLPEARLLRVFADPAAPVDYSKLDALAQSGYRGCAVFRACVDEIAQSVSEPRLLVERARGGGQWEEVIAGRQGPATAGHELLALLQNPGGDRRMSSTELRLRILQQDKIFGNSFTHKVRFRNSGRIGALRVLPVPYVQPHRTSTSRQEAITAIEYQPDGTGSFAPDPRILSLADVIHRRVPDPLDDFWGFPQGLSASREIDLDQKAIDYLRTFFSNGGTPSGLLSFKNKVSEPERKRIKLQWLQEFAGKKRHSTAVLDQDVSYETIGTRPDHLKLGESVFDVSESRICSVFGVPPIIIAVRLGIIRGTYSNYESARTSFWNETLKPLYTGLDEDFTLQLAHEFGSPGEYRIRHDLSNVRDLQESTEILWKRAMDAYDKGLVTRNEARKIVGLPSDGGGEHYKVKTTDAPAAEPEKLPEGAPKPPPAAAKPAPKTLQLLEAS